MNLQEYSQMYQLESTHWYFAGKRLVIQRVLQSLLRPDRSYELLDVGCGTGIILTMLERFGKAVGADSSPVALEFCRQRGLDRIYQIQVESELPFASDLFDVVTAFDLLEHLDDDLKLLREITRVCRTGGRILLTVPAHPFLWSEHDTALHHKRRYTRKSFELLLNDAGLQKRRLTYMNALLFPAAVLYRTMRNILPKNKDHAKSEFFVRLPPVINTMLFRSFQFESRLIPTTSLPIGLSLLGICEKS